LERLLIRNGLRCIRRPGAGWRPGAGRIVARPVDRAERIARDPGELVRLRQVRLSLRRVIRPECDAAGAIGAHERLAVEPPAIEPDIVAPEHLPASLLGQPGAERARFVRRRERLLGIEAEIADAAALAA